MATASSVTGVGQGSAIKAGQKGWANEYLGVEHLIGTRVVHAGSISLASGANAVYSGAVVSYPQPLPGVDADYVVICQANTTNSAWATSGSVNGFQLHATSGDIIGYATFRVDNATVSSFITHD